MTNKIPHYKQKPLGSLIGKKVSERELKEKLRNFKDVDFEEEEVGTIINHIKSFHLLPEEITEKKSIKKISTYVSEEKQKKEEETEKKEEVNLLPQVSLVKYEITDRAIKKLRRQIGGNSLENIKTLKNKKFFKNEITGQLKILAFTEDEIETVLNATEVKEPGEKKEKKSSLSFVSNLFKSFLERD